MKEELWKDIEGYEGLYQVSNRGRVRSFLMKNGRGLSSIPHILMAKIDKYGYEKYNLRKNGVTKTFTAHRLVAKAFIHNLGNKDTINHIDGNKRNNNVFNLEWASVKENIHHAYRTGLTPKTPLNNKKSKRTMQYDVNDNLIKIWPSLHEIERILKFNHSCISRAAKKEKLYNGYFWRYAE